MLTLGLTGSLAMGKSTVATMFAEAGATVFDADATVHDLYRGAAVPAIEAAFPETTMEGVVDRAALGARVAGDGEALARLEAIVHPLVLEAEERFLAEAATDGRRVAVLDIPLLFETGGDKRVDATIVVTTTAEEQQARLTRRDDYDESRFAALVARQMPDAEKRARAHFVIDTSGPLDATRAQVGDVMRAVAALASGR